MDKAKLSTLLIPQETTIKQAIQKLNETAEKILFVVDAQNKLLGTITDGDIRRGILKGFGFAESIRSIMHANFFSVKASRNKRKNEDNAQNLMIEKKITQIPLLDKEQRIIDVILWTDVLEEKISSKREHLYANPVVIMAGGKGTRLDPFTRIFPKPLIPIGNKAVIELIMENFYKYGFHRFIYTLNYRKEYIKLFLKEYSFPYGIEFVEESDFLGTAGSLSLLEGMIQDTFFVNNCDSLVNVNFEKLLKWHQKNKAAVTILGCHNELTIPFGVLQLHDGKLDKILEKPVHDTIINTGIYVVEPHVISYIPKGRHMDMNTLLNAVAKKEKVSVYPITTGWFDIGHWEEYQKTASHFKNLPGE